jgi:hypothetical protein
MMTLGFVILLVGVVLGAAAFGLWRLVRSQTYYLMDE